jgi:hypothetical protein
MLFTILLLSVCSAALAQPTTGFPPFGSMSGGGGESIDNANLNVHLAIPVIGKPGRGIPFDFTLNFDGSVWGPVPSGSSKVWAPVSNWGWTGVTVAQTGYVTYSTTQGGCSYGTGAPPPMYYWNSYHGFVYHDPSGGQHAIPISTSNWQPGAPCGQGTSYGNATGSASDGSGYTMTVYVTTAVNSATVVSLGGTTRTLGALAGGRCRTPTGTTYPQVTTAAPARGRSRTR